MTIHDVRDFPLAVETGSGANQLEPGARRIGRQMHAPVEARKHRALDRRWRLPGAERGVHRETLDVIRGEFGGHDTRRPLRRLVEKRAADNSDERRRESERRKARGPGRPGRKRTAWWPRAALCRE